MMDLLSTQWYRGKDGAQDAAKLNYKIGLSPALLYGVADMCKLGRAD